MEPGMLGKYLPRFGIIRRLPFFPQIIEFIQNIVLFSGQASKKGSWTADDDRLARMIEVLGPFPPQLLERGKHTAEFFNERGKILSGV